MQIVVYALLPASVWDVAVDVVPDRASETFDVRSIYTSSLSSLAISAKIATRGSERYMVHHREGASKML